MTKREVRIRWFLNTQTGWRTIWRKKVATREQGKLYPKSTNRSTLRIFRSYYSKHGKVFWDYIKVKILWSQYIRK